MRLSTRFALIVSLSLFGAFAFAQDKPGAAGTDPTTVPATATAVESSDARLASPRVRLIGQWEEYSPSRNFVDFYEDGRVAVYLKRGEVGDLKTLDGTWSIDDEQQLRVDFTVNGQTFGRIAGLRFENGEMLLKELDATGQITRHRRREGALPEDYRW
ncbi:MAG: hypothetical protein KA144_13245 [Xanthomonadaceae bacterium]|nr:hypothetical protein [Xanthomonadaceae bacterium]